MSVLRILFLSILLVALLPWGAYLRAMPAHPGGSLAGQAVQQATTEREAMQLPTIKCRKGLPASPCSPETKALVAVSEHELNDDAQRSSVASRERLPAGLSSPPALPPPRPV